MKKFFIWTFLLFALALHAQEALAGCSAAPTAGNDVLSCTAQTPPDPQAATINLQSGNDSLTVKSGTLSGGVSGTTGV
jgi:hypothetical protein